MIWRSLSGSRPGAGEDGGSAGGALIIVGAASGGLPLVSGARPADWPHLLYALIAIELTPLARSFHGRSTGRGAAILVLVAFVVLGAVLYRLFATG